MDAHLQQLAAGLPNAAAADIKQLSKILRQRPELAGEAFEILLKGKSPTSLLGYSIVSERRKNSEKTGSIKLKNGQKIKPSFVSLDDGERDEEDFSAVEKIAATDPAVIANYRQQTMHGAAESALDLVTAGSLAIGRCALITCGKALGRRRGEQIRAANIQKHEEARSFDEGGKGQGGLFCFDGEVV